MVFSFNSFASSKFPNRLMFIRVITASVQLTLDIFLLCYFGHELFLVSSKLLNAIFYSNWIEDEIDKKSMFIFMENLKRDMEISAFKIFHINLDTFTTIVNSTYSLLAVLQNLNSQLKKLFKDE